MQYQDRINKSGRQEDIIRILSGRGTTGLELESQRTTQEGLLAVTDHPFPEDPFIDRDFGEAQIEVNTSVGNTVEEAVELLHGILRTVQKKLEETGELLWPFSNPPVIRSEEDIRIAQWSGEKHSKTLYREYLAEKYGKYLMTFCGVHFNYSFDEEALRELWRKQTGTDSEADTASGAYKSAGDVLPFRIWNDNFYLDLTKKALAASWVITALLSASPLADGSFYNGSGMRIPADRKAFGNISAGETVDTGYSSVRCSENGYWNLFDPVLSYKNIEEYVSSIRKYLDRGLINYESELYYPVRLKPRGAYSCDRLLEKGANHIEIRVIDLNPFSEDGVSINDLKFLELLLQWLASLDCPPCEDSEQLFYLYNMKACASSDWDNISLKLAEGSQPMVPVLTAVLEKMKADLESAGIKDLSPLEFQIEKVRDPEKRYSALIKKLCGNNYLQTGIDIARSRQQRILKEQRL